MIAGRGAISAHWSRRVVRRPVRVRGVTAMTTVSPIARCITRGPVVIVTSCSAVAAIVTATVSVGGGWSSAIPTAAISTRGRTPVRPRTMPIRRRRRSAVGGVITRRAVGGMTRPGVASGVRVAHLLWMHTRSRVRWVGTRSHVRWVGTRMGMAPRVSRVALRLLHKTAADESLGDVEV